MEAVGLDVTVSEVPLAKLISAHGYDVWPRRSVPAYGYGRHVDALELHDIPTESPLRVAGLADGDQLLSVDGYRFDDDSFRDIDTLAIQKRGWVVVELARAAHHVVLSIRWDPKTLF